MKIILSRHTFTSLDSFSRGVLPTKQQVEERILHLKNFQTLNATKDIAKETNGRWV